MKLLITGVGGQLGTKLWQLSQHDNYGTYFGDTPKNLNDKLFQLDLTNRENTISTIEKVEPDWIVHCAAATDVDWCEREKKASWSINVEATRNVVDACKLAGSGITYVSTSFVFNGKKESYKEDDLPDPINNYGLTKLEGEKIVQSAKLPFIIVRTDQLYGWGGVGKKQSFVVKTIDALKRGDKLEVFQDWYNNPTLVHNLADAILKLVNLRSLGIYHATGSSFVNRYEWALMIAEIFGLDTSLIVPIDSSKFNPVAKRPKVKMDNSKIQSVLKMLTVKEGIEFLKTHPEDKA